MVRRGFIIGVVLYGMLLHAAYAQDGTPTPTAGIIYQQSAAVFFPSAIQFTASLAARQETLASGTLTLFQASGFEQTVELTFEGEDGAVSGAHIDTTDLLKLVVFEGEAIPRPFEPLNYRWQIVTDDERVSEVADEMLFQPSGGNWQQIDTPPLTFWWHNERLGMGVLRENLLTIYALLEKNTGEAPQLNFVVYDADYRFCDAVLDPDTNVQREVMVGNANLPCSVDELKQYLAQNNLIFIQRQDNDFGSLENQLISELVTRFYGLVWDEDLSVPSWFTSGLAQLYRQTGDFRALVTARAALEQEALFTLEGLENAPPIDAAQKAVWEAQSYLLVLYLADCYGASAPFELARSLVGASSFESAFQDLTDMTLSQAYRAYRGWLGSKAAEVAVLWNPYLATTPTPTFTPSSTPIPPTQTPTYTPTITLTPTSTSLIGRIPTEVVVTRTPEPPTPVPTVTNTPLPPGSLPTATPRPVSDDEGGLPCTAPAVILPTIGLVLAWKRKRKL